MRLPGTDCSYEWGAIWPANTAMISSPSTMTPPMAPSGLRRAKLSTTRAIAGTRHAGGSAWEAGAGSVWTEFVIDG